VRRPSLTVFFLAVLVAAGGCSGGKSGSAEKNKAGSLSSTTTPVVAPPSVTVTAREYGFDVPNEIEGGVVRMTLQNDGKLKHEAVIVAAGDTPLEALKHDLGPVVSGEGQPTPAYLGFRGGVSLVPAGASGTATLALPPGQFVLC